jgi:hypothetical protein
MKSVKVQAALDLIKVAGIAVAAGIGFSVASNLFGIANVLMVGSFALMAVCFYQLFKIRCEQIEMARKYETLDKTK